MLKAVFEWSSRTFAGDKVLYHCQSLCSAWPSATSTVFARGKRFNRETVSLVKLAYLSTPRLSVSVLFSLVRQSVLHDKAWVCRFAPLAESLTRKPSTFRCPLAFKSHSFKDNLSSYSCEFKTRIITRMNTIAFLFHRFENYSCISNCNYSSLLRIISYSASTSLASSFSRQTLFL